ncbi:MAG: GerMN domain-containing protein [Actinomycetota bacterium]|nr:GerMN domain-containing protein [Actinomycetota bacterium]
MRPTGDETPGPAGGEVGEVVCLVLDGRLVQSVRRVATAPSAQQQLDELVAGPTPSERNRGLVTTLAGLALTVRDQSGTGVTVEVAEPDDGNARSDEVLAYGQVVCTLTARAEVNSVVFTRDGQQLQVPRADGALVTEPLQLRDFADLIGPA